MNPTDPVVQSLIDTAKLNPRDAKTCIYWRLASRYSAQLQFFPALALVGPSGSGKTSIMDALHQMPGESSDILACTIFTMASLRDELEKYRDKLFIADEFDEVKKEVGYLMMARTTRSMSNITFKRQVGDGNKYEQVTINIFGPTILHTRNLIDDPARSSRAIQIFTRHEDGPFADFDPSYVAMASLEFDMSQVVYKGGRTISTWSPILEIAKQLEDVDYLTEIQAELALEARILRQKAEYDNASVVLAKIVECITSRLDHQRWDRIDIDYAIGRPLRLDFDYLTPLVVNNIINQMGMETERKGGRRWLLPDWRTMKAACKQRHYEDAEFDGILTLTEAWHDIMDAL